MIINILLVFLVKIVNVIVPIVLMQVVDSIICSNDDPKTSSKTYWLTSDQPGCPPDEKVYSIIIIYIVVRFFAEFLANIREIPFADMAAVAEVSIAYDVYDHV